MIEGRGLEMTEAPSMLDSPLARIGLMILTAVLLNIGLFFILAFFAPLVAGLVVGFFLERRHWDTRRFSWCGIQLFRDSVCNRVSYRIQYRFLNLDRGCISHGSLWSSRRGLGCFYPLKVKVTQVSTTIRPGV